MITGTLYTKELFISLDDAAFEMWQLIASFNEKEINKIPFEDSWTAAQVAAHVIKSNLSIAKALNIEGRPADRNPDERVQELKETFLNFDVKFRSPQFIIPTQDIYSKEILLADLKASIEHLREASKRVKLSEIINVPAFGDVSKLELMHFVVFHIQRHIHQLKKMSRALQFQL